MRGMTTPLPFSWARKTAVALDAISLACTAFPLCATMLMTAALDSDSAWTSFASWVEEMVKGSFPATWFSSTGLETS